MNDRPSWDDVWLEVADKVAQRSLCSRAKVGAVIVTTDNRVAAVSYNGPPPCFNTGIENWCPRESKTSDDELDPMYGDCPAVHAESNAIARSIFADTKGGSCYVTHAVCFHCAKALMAAQIGRVIMRLDEKSAHRRPDDVIDFLRRSGAEVIIR